MKVIKVLLIIGFVALGLYIGSVIVMQRMINQASALADEHCLGVNPLIIQRKLVYLDTNQRFLETEDINIYLDGTKEYFSLADQYVIAERDWLTKLSVFMNGLDFKILTPGASKKVYEAQFKAYMLDAGSTEALSTLYVAGNNATEAEIERFTVLTSQKNDAYIEYGKAIEAVGTQNFIQKPFLRWPESVCPAENYDIPDVNDLMFPDSGKPETPEPVS